MISFWVVFVCVLRLAYLCWQFGECLHLERHVYGRSGAPERPAEWKLPPALSFLTWILLLVTAAFWGLTGNPFFTRHQTLWLQYGDFAYEWLLLLLVAAIILSYVAAFRYGQWRSAIWHCKLSDQQDLMKKQQLASRDVEPTP